MTHDDALQGKKNIRAEVKRKRREARSRSRLEINKGVEDKPPLNVNAFVPKRIFMAFHFHTQQRVIRLATPRTLHALLSL